MSATVFLSFATARTSAPCAISSSISSLFPKNAAPCRAVYPLLLFAVGLMPNSRQYFEAANQAFGQVGNASGQAVKGMQNALGGLGK